MWQRNAEYAPRILFLRSGDNFPSSEHCTRIILLCLRYFPLLILIYPNFTYSVNNLF